MRGKVACTRSFEVLSLEIKDAILFRIYCILLFSFVKYETIEHSIFFQFNSRNKEITDSEIKK